MTGGRGIRKSLALALVVAGVMTYLLATTFAGSATAQAGGVSVASITGAAFTPGDSNCISYSRDGYSGQYTDFDGCEFSAGIQLPHGATVLGVFVFYDANGTSAQLHFEESGPFQGHEDIAEVDLDDCGNDTCVAFDVQLESPDVNNLFFGYAAWVSPSCCEFTLFRVAVVYTTPAGAGPAVTPNNIPKGGKAVNPKKDH
jgi:hypothetical protein